MGLTKATYSLIDSTTVNVLDFVPPAEKALIEAGTPSTNVASYIQAAHDSLPLLGGNYQGTLYFPAGKYKVNSGLTICATVNVQGYGAILDFSNLSASGTAISCWSNSTGSYFDTTPGEICGLSLVGPGHANTSSNGIFFGDTDPAGIKVCHEHSYRDLIIQEFGNGLNQGNNSYNLRFYNCLVYRCNINVYLPQRANSAECIEFHSTVLAESYQSCLYCKYNSLDVQYFGGSIDYPVGTKTGVEVDGDTIVSFYGTHFEGSQNTIFISNYVRAGNPAVNCYGCTFTLQDGNDFSHPAIAADNIHLTVIGGWCRYGGSTTLSVFIDSSGIYNLLFQNMLIYGPAPTYLVYYGSSTSGNKSVNNQQFTPGTIVSEYKALTMFGLGTNFGVYFRTAAGAPANSLAGIEQGSILLNQADKKLYINTGTSSSTTWTVVGTQT